MTPLEEITQLTEEYTSLLSKKHSLSADEELRLNFLKTEVIHRYAALNESDQRLYSGYDEKTNT